MVEIEGIDWRLRTSRRTTRPRRSRSYTALRPASTPARHLMSGTDRSRSGTSRKGHIARHDREVDAAFERRGNYTGNVLTRPGKLRRSGHQTLLDAVRDVGREKGRPRRKRRAGPARTETGQLPWTRGSSGRCVVDDRCGLSARQQVPEGRPAPPPITLIKGVMRDEQAARDK